MRHGSLFSGIGGFDLAAQWMQWENIFHCEWNEFRQKILKYYWPNAQSYSDITQTDFSIYRGGIDILTGGFPCQPYSVAGKRKGKEDNRHLWPEMLRVIRQIQPRWVVGENVRGLTNWNGGMVFNEVQADLESAGYEVLPFLLPACAVNAPHRRDRIWFIAHCTNAGIESLQQARENGVSQSGPAANSNSNDAWRYGYGKAGSQEEESEVVQKERQRIQHLPSGIDDERAFADTASIRRIQSQREHESKLVDENGKHEFIADATKVGLSNGVYAGFGSDESQATTIQGSEFTRTFAEACYWEKFPTQPPIRIGNDEISAELDGITVPRWARESIQAAGDAIVPHVALQIFKAIEKYESHYEKR